MSDEVLAYQGLVESVATELSRFQRDPVHDLTEFEDLAQEGYIAVWEALVAGIHPGRQRVTWAMQNYIRRQRGERELDPTEVSFDDELHTEPYSAADILDA